MEQLLQSQAASVAAAVAAVTSGAMSPADAADLVALPLTGIPWCNFAWATLPLRYHSHAVPRTKGAQPIRRLFFLGAKYVSCARAC